MSDIVTSIKEKLNEIEHAENVRVIMAVESGSRAWGFESPDSDYDVRFIYVRRAEDYIKLKPVRDVIEWQLDEIYDIDGWDLQKALRLLHDSNPTLHEWCNSPIVYKENELADPFRELVKTCFLPKKAIYHYIHMAESAYNNYLTGDEVRIKKYFYALRPILAAKWVASEKTAPPMMFGDLVDSMLEPELKPEVEALLEIKKRTAELGTAPKIAVLDDYINTKLSELRAAADREPNRKNTWETLEEFFRSAVMG